ncbi:MAG: type III pantothenate kinase [Polaribacter sp.]
MNLIIDVGNTRVKAAVFEQYKIVELLVFDKKRMVSEIKSIIKKHKIASGIISNVASISEKKLSKIQSILQILVLSSSTKIPFKNLYKTPKTLGVDRIALIASAVKKYPKKNTLVIDAGTCITYDFVNKESEYLGGAISLGIAMRFKALHAYTSKLPLLDKNTVEDFIGKSTKESINSGVVNGILKEVEGIIADYKEKYIDLTVVLTGGDANFLAKQLKSSIFANQNFLLEGLNEILIFNKEK